jgi:hypothetical protein
VIRPLLAVELRRQRPVFLRMVVLTVLVGIVFFVAGKRDPESLLASLIGCSIGVVLLVPMGISRDKMEGTLDFICGLPVETRDIAASRLIAVALFALPWALGIGLLSIAARGAIPLTPVAAAVLAWLAMLFLGAIAIALFSCFDLESLLGAPAVALIVAAVVMPRLVHALIPDLTQTSILHFLAWRGATPLLMSVFLTSALAIVLVSLAISARALNNFGARPFPAK